MVATAAVVATAASVLGWAAVAAVVAAVVGGVAAVAGGVAAEATGAGGATTGAGAVGSKKSFALILHQAPLALSKQARGNRPLLNALSDAGLVAVVRLAALAVPLSAAAYALNRGNRITRNLSGPPTVSSLNQ